MEEITVRCVMYKSGELVDYFDFPIDGVEHSLRDFEDAVDDEMADKVQIILYKDNRRVTSWNTPVDRFFREFLENVAEELIDERFVTEVEVLGED